MLQRAVKTLLVLVVLGLGVQNANAFGHRWGGCGWGGCGWGYCGGYGYGGWGWGYPGYVGYGWGGYPYGYYGVWANAAPTRSIQSTESALAAKGSVGADSLMLTVNVPEDAKVQINGHQTTTTGKARKYVSNGVKPGSTYTYQVRADYVRDGQPVSEVKSVTLTAGQIGAFAFGSTPKPQVADVAQVPQR